VQPANATAAVPPTRRRRLPLLIVAAVVVASAAAAAVLTRHAWWPPLLARLVAVRGESVPAAGGPHVGQAAAPDHEHAASTHPGHNDATCLQMSAQAQRNVGLTLTTVELRDFERATTLPATIVERPGRTETVVSAPMAGIVTRVIPIRGEAVAPGQPLFEIRLTHEDLVQKQSQLLRSVEELDVVKREVERLAAVTSSGAVAGKALLERQYEQQKIEALIRAERQALILHGLTEPQIDEIIASRKLLPQLTVAGPRTTAEAAPPESERLLQVANVAVRQGEYVDVGARLCTLTDHAEVYIEGRAFEQDAALLDRLAKDHGKVAAVVEEAGRGKHEIAGLTLLYVENEVERESRALRFYARLPNQLVRNETTPDGHRFIAWQFRPGQRLEVRVPVERWPQRIVLPLTALVNEGAEWFVYQQIGDHFDRRGVQVEYRDPLWAVIASDGALFPGDTVAATGAYQIHLALKNKSGGGADPHAGHHH
jgi:hypothetical protein